ncbi:MAG: sporulation protein YabP [Clostridia bacterium]|nr:sporulation protein YabP [Clostridia bacterium]
MEENKIKMPQNLVLEDRKRLSVSGVKDVDSFDEESMIVYTELGELTVRGNDLHINNLSVQTGELVIEGSIYALVYTDDSPKKESFFGRIFR